MTTWQELASTTAYGTHQEWRAIYERLESTDRLEYWEPGVVPAARRGYSPTACLRLIDIFEAAREPDPPLTEEDLDQLANYTTQFLAQMRRHDQWIPWVLFALGLLLVCVVVAQLLLAVADAR